jgi:hypothetical protein
MAILDAANTKKVLQTMNTLGGGAAGVGVSLIALAGERHAPVITVKEILDEAVIAGYCTVLQNFSSHYDERDNWYQVTANGITYSNS